MAKSQYRIQVADPEAPPDGNRRQFRVSEFQRHPIYDTNTGHGSSLKRFIGRFMSNSSNIEDIAQEAFLRAYTLERGRPIEQPKSFLPSTWPSPSSPASPGELPKI